VFATGASEAAIERMRIDSAGLVGIGTSTPTGKLNIISTTEQLRLGYDASNYNSFTVGSTGNLKILATGTTPIITLESSGVVMEVTTAGDSLLVNNASSGNLLRLTYDNQDRFKVDINGIITTNFGGGATDSVCSNAGVLSAVSGPCDPSSIRFKNNVESITGTYGLDTVMKMRPVSYNLISNGEQKIGFIAEELLQIEPRLIAFENGDPTMPRSVRYGEITTVLTKAVQELNLSLKGLEERVINLELNAGGGVGEGGGGIGALGKYAVDFFSAGVQSIVDGVVYMKGIVVEKLTVGSSTKRTGITFFDEVTGDPYCLSVANGAQKMTAGECVVVEADSQTALVVDGSSSSGGSTSSNGGDITSPVITLTGEEIINLNVGDEYIEQGATVTDDTDTSVAVIISGSVDTATFGVYVIHYNATDTAGNSATEVTRTINVNEIIRR
jgi:hypothetical protein